MSPFFCPPRGVEWLFLQECSYKYFPVFPKNLPALQFEESRSEDILRWSVGFVWRGPCSLGFSILLHIWSRSCHQYLSVRPLCRQNSINRSLSMSAASIASLMQNFHPVHPLVWSYKMAQSLDNKQNLHFIFSQKTDFLFQLKTIFY